MFAVADNMSHMLAQVSATGQWLAAHAHRKCQGSIVAREVKRVRSQLEYHRST